ncbi:hypothetical protein JVX98_13290 [Ensifer sp. PDNC004]|uniref:helix-turn-helix domain-containing protein n=1 Tax=Ensifer sp. PDNC004 TaxID=2811423 RepID=UPI001964CC7B|nr:helix-turn-helix domain-containing protein [Ensifer sp. PDNC004]QRY69189.1 hypothetical protein JVX98_13290 [Ensifer sp. PDNC004]
MMWVQAESYTSAADMERQYAARRARLMGKPAQEARPGPVERPEPAIVLVYRDQNPKDAHVRAWEYWKAEMGSPCRAYIKRRCDELGVAYEAVIGPSRIQKFVDARQLLMWEIKTIVKPSISWPELGRLFGGRDHTTAFHAVHKVEASQGERRGTDWLERKARSAKATHERRKARGA